MTPEEFEQAMLVIEKEVGWDPEAAHCRMDALIVQTMKALGYQAGIKVFEEQHKY